MFHRFASRTGLFVTALFAAAVFASSALAQTSDPIEGQDYVLIDPPVATQSGDKIEVVEVFGYSCSHCANFAPIISKWKTTLADDVKLEYVPAVFGGIWEVYGRVFYTGEMMGVTAKTHDALFEALHVQRRPVNKVEDLADFYAEHGVKKEEFLSTMESFPITGKIEEARQRVTGYGVEGTPTMVVAGKYRVMAPRHGGFERMLEVTDALVAKERAAKAAAK